MWIVVRIMCGDVATPIIFSYMDTHPMGGRGVSRRRSAVWKIYVMICGIYMVLNGIYRHVTTN